MRYYLFAWALLLSGCTAEMTGATVEGAREKCAANGGIGSMQAEAAFFDYVTIHCANGTRFRLVRGQHYGTR